MYYDRTLTTRYVSPKAFLYLDQKGYVQENVPLIYHFSRYNKNNNKKLKYLKSSSSEDTNVIWRQEM